MNATKIATNALNAIKKSGTTFILTRKTVSVSGSEPWKKSSSSTSTQTLNGILDDFETSERDGNVVLQQDRRYIVASSGMTGGEPNVGDLITDGSKDLRIESVETTRAKNIDVIYTLHTRGYSA
tara:strand:+ start:164 stop:535 length:372 start_codon:yes stop_codon:yes gene_type:complete